MSLTSISRRDLLRLSLGGAASITIPSLSLITPAYAATGHGLENKIEKAVKSMRRRGLLDGNERTAWSIYDFTSGVKLVSINENRPMQAASMIKPFVAQAFFIQHQANPARYPYRQTEKQIIERMIRYSSNTATNQLIDIVGKRAKRRSRPRQVERILKSHGGGVFKQTSIVEYIPRGGRTYRNSASARDYSRFLYATWNNNLPFADELKHYMGLPNKDRIVTRVPSIPNSVDVYDKTGSTSRLCGDMGIVVGKDSRGNEYPYTFIGMIERDRRARSYTRWINSRSNALREISALAYDHMKSVYRLS